MITLFHRHFIKGYKKFPKKPKNIGEQFKSRLKIFLDDPFYPVLLNHALSGKYQGLRSINVTGDIRALYQVIDEESVEFMLIDTHSNLYD